VPQLPYPFASIDRNKDPGPAVFSAMSDQGPANSKHTSRTRFVQVLTLAGAFLVFATFVTKEIIRDHAKEIANSVALSQTMFMMERHKDRVLSQVVQAQYDVQDLTERLSANSPRLDKEIFDNVSSELVLSAEDNQKTSESLDSVEQLLEKLPSRESHKEKIQELKIKLGDFYDRVSHSITEVAIAKREWETKRKDAKWLTQQLEPIRNKIFRYTLDVLSNSTETNDLADEVLKEAKIEVGKKEKRADIADRISIWTYSLGWSLAVAGKLWGFKESEPD
jgi:hypothetical protein